MVSIAGYIINVHVPGEAISDINCKVFVGRIQGDSFKVITVVCTVKASGYSYDLTFTNV